MTTTGDYAAFNIGHEPGFDVDCCEAGEFDDWC